MIEKTVKVDKLTFDRITRLSRKRGQTKRMLLRILLEKEDTEEKGAISNGA